MPDIVGTVHSLDMVACKTHVGLVRKQLQDNQREITQAGVTRKRWARLAGSRRQAGHTLHKPITQVTCLKPYCTITISSLVQVPPTHYTIFFSQLTGRN